MDKINVIVVEDETGLRDQMVAYLALSGLNAVGVGSAAELYRRLAVERFSVIVLDLGLPDEDGLSVATHVRAHGDVGIIVVTARGMPPDRIKGFDSGVDIYMVKPVEFAEVAAAARRLARRVAGSVASPATPPQRSGQWLFDSKAFTLTAPNGVSIALTAKELALMTKFLQCEGAVASRVELLDTMGYSALDPDNRSLDAAIRRLRLKVSEQADITLPIQTVHAVGYAFTARIIDPRAFSDPTGSDWEMR